jgi:hypothetical protein
MNMNTNVHELVLLGFGTVALGGMAVAVRLFAKGSAPLWLRNVHGLAGLAALVALFAMNLLGEAATPTRAWWAFGLLLAGFTGGMVLLRVLFQPKPPSWLVLFHAAIGITGIVLLYTAFFEF